MLVRQLITQRTPWRILVGCGIALALAVVLAGMMWRSAQRHLAADAARERVYAERIHELELRAAAADAKLLERTMYSDAVNARANARADQPKGIYFAVKGQLVVTSR